jgi:FtsP/CotA-like multicopper oxidase with cupredoxin domain
MFQALVQGRAAAVVLLASSSLFSLPASAAATESGSIPKVVANDNRRPAGRLEAGTLKLSLRAGRGSWQPEGPDGPRLSIEAFGEDAFPLSVPAPLIRAETGTLIDVTLRNDLDAQLQVHGLCARDGAACPPLAVPARDVRHVQFRIDRPGTYHYWATTIGAPVPFRELAGGLVIDPRGAPVDDRVLVITEWTSLTPSQLGEVIRADDPGKVFVGMKPRVTFVINGLSWPATERLTYRVGETARWRVINLSSQPHPMHLHGFYFEVNGIGDGLKHTPIDPADRHPVVTHLLTSGTTMSMTWTPERAGNWLFHCHLMHHVSMERRLGPSAASGHAHAGHGSDDASSGMAGMILGVTVLDAADPVANTAAPAAGRKMTLTMERRGAGGEPGFGFGLSGDRVPPGMAAPVVPGPALVLKRGEPVEITVVNRLGERTAVHWHGMELDSYYDGVHGWSGAGSKLAPMIEPDGSFMVRFTPPRSGTFIYHTHLHDERQLPLGLYGPMLVVDDDRAYQPETDHVVVVGQDGVDPAAPDVLVPTAPLVINGQSAPVFTWKAGVRHRVRLINITPETIVSVSMQTSQGPLTWLPVAKDGAPLPAGRQQPVAARQTIAVGETYDFEIDLPPGRRTVWLEVRSPAGRWQAQGQVMAK